MNYKPKSNTPANDNLPEKKVEKVVTGAVSTRKKSEIKKLTDVFLAEDMDRVKTYILFDVVIPGVKKAIQETINAVLWGEGSRSSGSTPAAKINYGSYYNNNNNTGNRPNIRTRDTYGFENISFDNRGDAEQVLDCMADLIQRYEIVSVADMYDLCGVTCDYTDYKYGWTDLRGADVLRNRDKFFIKLPKPMPID